ncbi:MAG: hypothetical protein Q7T03_06815 [Deltaproteobacteria bacterium]|nr:hypothetical protein [Deltaproteobacteria bacterium]
MDIRPFSVLPFIPFQAVALLPPTLDKPDVYSKVLTPSSVVAPVVFAAATFLSSSAFAFGKDATLTANGGVQNILSAALLIGIVWGNGEIVRIVHFPRLRNLLDNVGWKATQLAYFFQQRLDGEKFMKSLARSSNLCWAYAVYLIESLLRDPNHRDPHNSKKYLERLKQVLECRLEYLEEVKRGFNEIQFLRDQIKKLEGLIAGLEGKDVRETHLEAVLDVAQLRVDIQAGRQLALRAVD